MTPKIVNKSAPKGILLHKEGPTKPLVQSVGIPDVKAQIATVQNSAISRSNSSNLNTEVSEAIQIHSELVNKLSDTSALKYPGQVLQSIIGSMTPQGVALMIPVLTDFSIQATPSLTPVDFNTPAPIQQLVEFVSNLPKDQWKYLESSVNLLFNKQQNSASLDIQTDLNLVADILKGYSTVASGTAVLAEQIATFGPRAWMSISQDMKTPGLEGLASSIGDLAREVYTAYSFANANLLATHATLSKSDQKKKTILSELNNLASQAHTVTQIISYYNSAKNNNSTLENAVQYIESTITFYVQIAIREFISNTEAKLKKSLTKNIKAGKNDKSTELLKILQKII